MAEFQRSNAKWSEREEIYPTSIARLINLLPGFLRRKIIGFVRRCAPSNRWGDKLYFDLTFLSRHGRLPREPALFNNELYRIITTEEILRPERQYTSDKYLTKLFAKSLLSEDISVPTLGLISDLLDVKKTNFPSECVIKPTNSAGKVIFRRSGDQLDFHEIESWFVKKKGKNIGQRERNYQNLRTRVIIEPILFDGHPIHDYKFFCVNGKVKSILFVHDRNVDLGRIFLTPGWEPLPIFLNPKVPDSLPERPETLEKMILYAEKLSNMFDFVRIDFFSRNDEFYLGEIGHVHMRCLEVFRSIEEEKLLSKFLFE